MIISKIISTAYCSYKIYFIKHISTLILAANSSKKRKVEVLNLETNNNDGK